MMLIDTVLPSKHERFDRFVSSVISFVTKIAGSPSFDRQKLLRWIFILEVGNNILLALLVMSGHATPWTITFLALTNGTLRAAQMTTATALIPNLVSKEHLLNAIALNQATQQGARMAGALAIVPLLGLVNIESAFWLSGALYLFGFYFVSRVAIRSTGAIDKNQGFLANLFEGFVYVYKRPLIMSMVLLVLAHCALTMSYESLLPAISQDKIRCRIGGCKRLDRRRWRRGAVNVDILGRSP